MPTRGDDRKFWANIEMQGHQFALLGQNSDRRPLSKKAVFQPRNWRKNIRPGEIYDCVNSSAFYTKSINID